MEERLICRRDGESDLIFFQYLSLEAGQDRAAGSSHPTKLHVLTKELSRATRLLCPVPRGCSPAKVAPTMAGRMGAMPSNTLEHLGFGSFCQKAGLDTW